MALPDPGGPVIAAFTFSDRSVLVVGASGALGSRIARLAADRGARLTLVGGTKDHLDALDLPGERLALDLRLPGNVEQAVAAATEAHGGLHAVVNAAGVVAFGMVSDLSIDTVEELFLLNTFMPIALASAALPAMTDGGVIANVSAIVAEQPQAGMAAYSASKAALTAFDRALQREARRAKVTVLDIRPPHTETGLADRPIAGTAPKLPEGKDPDDVARRIVEAIERGDTELTSDAF